MRSAEETLSLFKQVLKQRRQYVRNRIKEIPKPVGRERGHVLKETFRGGELSELATIEAVLKMIENGDSDVLNYWEEESVDNVNIVDKGEIRNGY